MDKWTYEKSKTRGIFPVVRINIEGKYPVSQITNIKANNFGLDKTDRWKSYKRKYLYI